MKLLVLYRPNSEHARKVEDFIHDFQRLHPTIRLEEVSLNTRDGASMASLYDIPVFPAILATRDDGSVLNIWQGQELPLMNEVASYA